MQMARIMQRPSNRRLAVLKRQNQSNFKAQQHQSFNNKLIAQNEHDSPRNTRGDGNARPYRRVPQVTHLHRQKVYSGTKIYGPEYILGGANACTRDPQGISKRKKTTTTVDKGTAAVCCRGRQRVHTFIRNRNLNMLPNECR